MSELVWHYTNAQGLMGILQSNAIWASSCAVLNDKSEIEYSKEVINEILEYHYHDFEDEAYNNIEGSDEFDYEDYSHIQRCVSGAMSIAHSWDSSNVFIACASKSGNDLGQWREYSGLNGYALGLEKVVPLTPPKIIADQTNDAMQDQRIYWQDVSYGVDLQYFKSIFFAAYKRSAVRIKEAYEQDFFDFDEIELEISRFFAPLITCTKHPGFTVEGESRLIVDQPDIGLSARFRAGNYGIGRYIELTAVNSTSDATFDHSGAQDERHLRQKLPIRKILLGPAISQEQSRIELCHLLKGTGYDHVEVEYSNLPAR